MSNNPNNNKSTLKIKLFFYICLIVVMPCYTDDINLIIEQFSKEHYDFKIIESTFESIVLKFGNELSKNNIKNPYKKAHNQLLKLIQIKLNKTNLKINIYDFFPECKSIYVIQMI